MNLAALTFMGTVIQYYDYTIYGLSASLLARYFFADVKDGLLNTFMIFAVSSLAKPISAIVFGRVGDLKGRAKALRVTMMGIGLPTLAIGLLPGYQDIGIFAGMLLFLCRFIIAGFVSAEADGARIFLLESTNHSCLKNSIVSMGTGVGTFLASIMVFLSTQLHTTWGWRIPFIFGGLCALIMIVLRKNIAENSAFLDHKRKFQNQKFTPHWINIIATILMCGSIGGLSHFFLIFFVNHIEVANLVGTGHAKFYSALALANYSVCALISGWLADRIGVTQTISIGVLSIGILLFINNYLLASGYIPWWLLIVNAGFISLITIPGYIWAMGLFDIGQRYRSLSLGHALGSLILSNTTPMCATFLTKYHYSPMLWVGLLLLSVTSGLIFAKQPRLSYAY